MTRHVIELVTFKLAPGVSKEEFLKTVPPSNEFLEGCTGFISRRLSCNEDGTWVEHVEWDSMAAAKAASDAFMITQSLKPMMQAIDGKNAIMRHNQLMISVN